MLFSTNDTFELMRVLEEVSVNATYNPRDYLDQSSTLLRRTTKAAGKNVEREDRSMSLRKLEEVRLALARNLARAMVMGFDGPF